MLILQIKKALRWSAFFICTGILLGVFASDESIIQAKISYVIDGDTVILESGERVRLIGINAPEKESGNRVAEPFSLEARLALIEMVEGKEMEVILGEEKYDRYGRTLGYLQLKDGTDIQEKLISRGYGAVIAFPPNLGRIETYLQAESRARSAKKGIWSEPSFIEDLNRDDIKIKSGFHVVKGRVTKFSESKRNKIFSIGDKVALIISHKNWNEFWGEKDGELVGKVVESRGWLTKKGKYQWIVVRHPSMINQINISQ